MASGIILLVAIELSEYWYKIPRERVRAGANSASAVKLRQTALNERAPLHRSALRLGPRGFV